MSYPFYTIGHSTRSIDEFVALLRVADIRLVVDIRTIRRSRANPQYNGNVLLNSLAVFEIGYEHIEELGGLRSRSRNIKPSLNGFWVNQSFHNYADYALSSQFRQGLERLVALGRQQRCAIMCSETLWWRCHRRIVADYLISRGEAVFHLMGADKIEPAKSTDGVLAVDDGTLIYRRRAPPNDVRHYSDGPSLSDSARIAAMTHGVVLAGTKPDRRNSSARADPNRRNKRGSLYAPVGLLLTASNWLLGKNQ